MPPLFLESLMADNPVMIDGQLDNRLPVTDRGFQFGDGVFETMRLYAGGIPWIKAHLARLESGAWRLGLPCILDDIKDMVGRFLEMCPPEGVVRLSLTRGDSFGGYAQPRESAVRSVLQYRPLPSHIDVWQAKGVSVRICNLHLSAQPALAGIKHMNRLEQVLARQEWNRTDIQEGLMLDQAGRLVEGTMSNLFCVHGGTLLTPDLSAAGVEGVTREKVLQLAQRWSLPVIVGPVGMNDLIEADECFVTGSVMGVVPLVQLVSLPGDHNNITADWRIGPLTRKMQQGIRKQMEP
jgi:4-amino-4-deoxychorismate lyase